MLELEGAKVQVMQYHECLEDEEEEDDPKTLLLKGFKETMNEETIRVFMESKRHGGGDVTRFEYNKVKRQAVVTFKDLEG